MRPWKHRRLLVPAAIVAASTGVLTAFTLVDSEGDPGPATGLPDLTMSPPSELRAEPQGSGGHDLRFTSVMNNTGAADLVLAGERPASTGRWTIRQVVSTDTGPELRATGAVLAWGGDGHDHWHVVGAARYRLEGPDGEVRGDEKVGFCIFDGEVELPETSDEAPTYVERGCGDLNSDIVEMGLSVGWGDPYRSTLPGQRIDITGRPAGRYRLVASADPDGLFDESRTDNNEAGTDFDLSWDPGGVPTISLVPAPG